jgi:hypothetical protein
MARRIICYIYADTGVRSHCRRGFKHWDRGFEFHSYYGSLSLTAEFPLGPNTH